PDEPRGAGRPETLYTARSASPALCLGGHWHLDEQVSRPRSSRVLRHGVSPQLAGPGASPSLAVRSVGTRPAALWLSRPVLPVFIDCPGGKIPSRRGRS